jgi:hypothetical protein
MLAVIKEKIAKEDHELKAREKLSVKQPKAPKENFRQLDLGAGWLRMAKAQQKLERSTAKKENAQPFRITIGPGKLVGYPKHL